MSCQQRRHSIKVPKLYKTASVIVDRVLNERLSVKQGVYSCVHHNVKALYALVQETLQHTEILDLLFKQTKILCDVKKLNPSLAYVLTTELLWGKKHLPGNSKPVQTILAYGSTLQKQLTKLELMGNISTTSLKRVTAVRPRYVRINTLAIKIENAIEVFQHEGWQLVETPGSYPEFLKQVSTLNEGQFLQDYHINEVLVFPSGTDFHAHEMYLNGSFVLQDKASCFPALLLSPPPGSVVLDMCAAPGMKTTHLAAIMNDQGIIHAVDKDSSRLQVLCKMSEKVGATCVCAWCTDVVNSSKEEWSEVEYILVDPSCSGSGISGRANEKFHQSRIFNLATFQKKVLYHALTAFPSAKRVIYSTCSILPQENEEVVEYVLSKVDHFHLASDVLTDSWPNRGDRAYPCGVHCLYAYPELDLTNGFFIAVFDRNEDKLLQSKLNFKGKEIKKPECIPDKMPRMIRGISKEMYHTKGSKRKCKLSKHVSGT